MKEKKKTISEELLKEAIYDAIHEAAFEPGKDFGIYEINGNPYSDVCYNPDEALAHFKFDKDFVRDYLLVCRFIDEFIDLYYENNIDDIVANIKSDESSDVEWDI